VVSYRKINEDSLIITKLISKFKSALNIAHKKTVLRLEGQNLKSFMNKLDYNFYLVH
jgi:hypothetical protein